jgi:hypothetical protein
MRIWDVAPGYLARQQLLGEHRELHGLYNVLTLGKRGYANHPETRRWVGCLSALRQRHALLVEEMALRGYRHLSPLPQNDPTGDMQWPATYIDAPHVQFALLAGKYGDGRTGRIPLPVNTQALWAQHKYSLLARDPALYADIGPAVAHGRYRHDMAALVLLLTETLRTAPPPGRLVNALQHLWGHVADGTEGAAPAEPAALLAAIRREATRQQEPYLLHSTALCELGLWV